LALLAGALIVTFGGRFQPGPEPASVTRFTISPPAHVTLGEAMALSPDGRTLVYEGRDDSGRRLYRRTLDSLESAPIRGTEGGARPFFSPDGRSLGFAVERSLKKIPLGGGAAVTVVHAAHGLQGGAWLSDDTIVFGAIAQGLMRVSASGDAARPLTTVDGARGEIEHRSPVVLPGERAVLFTVHKGARDSQRVDAVALQTGRRSELVQGNGAWPLATGHLAFQRAGTVWVAPFDQARLSLTGPPTLAVEAVTIAADWSPFLAVSRTGSLAYVTGDPDPYPPRALLWVDRRGREERIDAPARAWWWPRLSPDGRRVGFHIMDPQNMDAWIYELDHGPLVRMTYHPLQDGYPLWTPDGKRIAFWSRQHGGPANLYLRSASLTGGEQRLTTSPNHQIPLSWADGGKLLVFQERARDTGLDIGVLAIDGDRTPRPLISGSADEGGPAVSPDGRWIAYHSNLSGTHEVYVQPFPALDGRWQVSTQGGVSPLWGPDGRELFYRSGRAVMSVPVATSAGAFRNGNARALFEGPYVPEEGGVFDAPSYAVAADGRRFLMMKQAPGAGQHIVVIVNWPEELKRLLAQK
jgi:serine/threonine-protein kinase